MSFIIIYIYSNNFIILIAFSFFYLLNKERIINIMIIFITFIMIKIIFFRMKEKINNFFFFIKKKIIIVLLVALILFFFTKKVIHFYIFFEIVSLIIFSLIFFSSFSNQRLKARIYIFIFITIRTFPILVIFFFINEKTIILIFLMGFSIKLPIIFFHLWLPKAHVEANFYDSIILASLLLKLGGYGIIVLSINKKINFLIIWSLVRILFLSLNIIFLMDLKIIFAYSSIIHINGIILIVLRNNFSTEIIFIIIIIRHAIRSSLIFYIIGLIYEFSFSRRIIINKNFLTNNYIFFIIIFLTIFINIAIPPIMTFFSEMYVYIAVINYRIKILLFLVFTIFATIIFNLIVLKNLGIRNINKFFKINQLRVKNLILIKEHIAFLIFMYWNSL